MLCGRRVALTRGGKRAGARSLPCEESGRAMVRGGVGGGHAGGWWGRAGRWEKHMGSSSLYTECRLACKALARGAGLWPGVQG